LLDGQIAGFTRSTRGHRRRNFSDRRTIVSGNERDCSAYTVLGIEHSSPDSTILLVLIALLFLVASMPMLETITAFTAWRIAALALSDARVVHTAFASRRGDHLHLSIVSSPRKLAQTADFLAALPALVAFSVGLVHGLEFLAGRSQGNRIAAKPFAGCAVTISTVESSLGSATSRVPRLFSLSYRCSGGQVVADARTDALRSIGGSLPTVDQTVLRYILA